VFGLQDENLQLEKARADLTLDLKRSTAAKEAAENVAKAAQEELQGVLAELDDAKHSTEAASTTSQFVRKVCSCWCCIQMQVAHVHLHLHCAEEQGSSTCQQWQAYALMICHCKRVPARTMPAAALTHGARACSAGWFAAAGQSCLFNCDAAQIQHLLQQSSAGTHPLDIAAVLLTAGTVGAGVQECHHDH
jgi:hypothetical protein